MSPATRDPTVLHSPVSPECVRVCQAKPEYVSHTSSVHATTIAGGSSPHDWQKVRGHESTAFSSCAPSCNFVGRPDSHEVLQENLNFNTAIPPGIRFSKVPVPSNLKEARQSQQWSQWSQAMDEEKSSLDAHDTMEYVERPTRHKVIPVHWIFSTKVDDYGNVLRFKARLVAQGCRQIPGIDVGEVFAPTSSFGARRAILAVGAALDFEVHQVDIKTAFLNGDLEEEVYVSQPPGYENGNPRVVCRLRKALYGLKQAPRAWHKTLDVKLQSMGYFPCKSDAGVYVKTSASGEKSYFLVYVDDLLIMSKGLDSINWAKEELKASFSVHDLGEVRDFLGCQIRRDRPNHLLYMSCSPKIEALAEKFGVTTEGGRVIDTPMHKEFCHTREPFVVQPEEVVGSGTVLPDGHRYSELVGSLLYIANTTRPDMAHAVGVLSRYRMSPTTAHWKEALRVLKYLVDTKDLALRLGGSSTVVVGHVDSDFAGDLDEKYSTTGFVLSVFGGAVVWCSTKQKSIATSTVEAEFMAASHAVKELAWLQGFLEELGVSPGSITLYCDSQGCIANLRNPINSKYTKHIAVRFHFAREAIAKGQVDIRWISSAQNVADMMTKALPKGSFSEHRTAVGLTQVSY